MGTTRVVIADDHNMLRAGVRSLLQQIESVELVGEAADGREALALVEQHRPDILLSDIAMPGLGGLEVAARVAAEYPEVGVIILSMHADEEYVRRAVRAGARGYLLKDSDEAELALAIRAVVRGETYLSPRASQHVVAGYLKQAEDAPAAGRLTPRQQEVLRLIAQGEPTKAIARRLKISAKTVETHRTQLMERLGIHDIAGLVRYAIRVGLIASD
jgi:DNA-binding NarL/FixJ family response regulator